MGDGRSLITIFTPGGEAYELPVTPESILIDDGHKMVRSSIMSVGEIAQLGDKKLKEMSFSSFFPEYYDTYVNRISGEILGELVEPQNFQDNIDRLRFSPGRWVEIIESMREEPVFVVVTFPVVRQFFWIADFRQSAIGGQGREINYEIRFVTYKELSIRTLRTRTAFTPPNREQVFFSTIPGDNEYYTEPGDTLVTISRKTRVPVEFLRAANNIVDSTTDIGERVNLHGLEPFSVFEDTLGTREVVVRPGTEDFEDVR